MVIKVIKLFTEWLVAAGHSVTLHHFSGGRLHSVRWEAKQSPKATLLQVTLAPSLPRRGKAKGGLLVYSLLPEEETAQLETWLQTVGEELNMLIILNKWEKYE